MRSRCRKSDGCEAHKDRLGSEADISDHQLGCPLYSRKRTSRVYEYTPLCFDRMARKAPMTANLARVVRSTDGPALRTRGEAADYMTGLPEQRAINLETIARRLHVRDGLASRALVGW